MGKCEQDNRHDVVTCKFPYVTAWKMKTPDAQLSVPQTKGSFNDFFFSSLLFVKFCLRPGELA